MEQQPPKKRSMEDLLDEPTTPTAQQPAAPKGLRSMDSLLTDEPPKSQAPTPQNAPQGVVAEPSTGSPTSLPAAAVQPAQDGVPVIPTDPNTPIAPMAPEHPVPDWATALPPATEQPVAPAPKIFAAGEGGGIVQPDGSVKDARQAKLEQDFAAVAKLDETLGKSSARQYSPEREQAMREAGTWSAQDQKHKDEAMLSVQGDLLRKRQAQFEKEYGAKEEGLQKQQEDLGLLNDAIAGMKQGAEIAQPIDTAQYNDYVKRYNEVLQQYQAASKPLQDEKADIDAGFDYLNQKDAESLHNYNANPAVKEAQANQGVIDKQVASGDYSNMRVVSTVVTKGARDATAAVLRTLGAIQGVTTDPLLGEGGNHNLPTRMADRLTKATENITQAPTQYGGPLFDKDWNVDTEHLFPKFLQAATSMAMLGASAATGGTPALVAASYLTTEEDYYKEGIQSGLSPDQAQNFSMAAATLTSLLEEVNPGPFVGGGKTIKGAMAQRALNAIRDGANVKSAVTDAAKYVLKEGAGEGLQEGLQGLGDVAMRNVTNTLVGDHKLDGSLKAQDLTEQVLLGMALGSIAAAGGRFADRPLHQQALDWAVRNHDQVVKSIQQSAYENKQELLDNFNTIYAKYKGNGLTDLPPQQAQKVASDIQKKEDIEKDIKEAPMDPVVAAGLGDPREMEREKVARDVLEGMGVTGQAQEDALIREGIIEAPLDAEGKPIKPDKKPKPRKPKADAVQERSPEEEIPRTGEAGQDQPINGEGVGLSEQGQEVAQPLQEEVAPAVNEAITSEVAPTQVNEPSTPQTPPLAQEEAVDVGVQHEPPQAAAEQVGLPPEQVKKTFATKRAYEGAFREEVKSEIEKTGLHRDIENQAEAETRADALIANVGIDAALQATRNGDVRGGARSVIRVRALEALNDEFVEATDPERLAEITVEQAKLTQETSQALLEGGREAAMMNRMYANSDLGFTTAAMTEKWQNEYGAPPSEEVLKKFQEIEKELSALKPKLAEAEQRAREAEGRAAIAAIQGSIARERTRSRQKPITSNKDATARMAASIRSLKIDTKNTASSFIIPPQLFNAAVEVVATTVEAGGTVADAIANGIQIMRSSGWYKGSTEEDQKQAEESFTDEAQQRMTKQAIRNAVDAGAKDITSVTQEVQKQIPDATSEQIENEISAYAKEVAMTKDQISSEVKRLSKDPLKASKKAVQKRIEELKQRIAQGDFSKPERKQVIADNELTHLNAEKLRLREQYDKEFYKNKLLNRTNVQKARDTVLEGWNLLRAFRATFDLSFVLMQGGTLTVSNLWHKPQAVANAMKNMWRAMRSEKKSEEWLHQIKAQDWYPLAKEAKLAITEPHAELSAREELFLSDWTRLIWNGIGKPLSLVSKGAHERWKAANPFRALERGAVGYLDTLRVERFLDGMNMLERKKASGEEVSKQDYKDVANAINTLTGRASLGPFEGISKGLTVAFFSPRLWASAIKTSTPYAFYHFGTMTPTARSLAMQDLGRTIGTTMGIVTLAAVYLNHDDDKETGVELDPRSSDFGKIKLGDIRIDPWGGKVQQVVLQSRLVAGIASLFVDKPFNAIKKENGELLPLGVAHRTPTIIDLGLRMATNKLSPAAGFLVKAGSTTVDKDGVRKDSFGHEYHMSKEAAELLVPIYFETINSLRKEDPGALEGFLMAYSLLGGGVDVYNDDDKAPQKLVTMDKNGRVSTHFPKARK